MVNCEIAIRIDPTTVLAIVLDKCALSDFSCLGVQKDDATTLNGLIRSKFALIDLDLSTGDQDTTTKCLRLIVQER